MSHKSKVWTALSQEGIGCNLQHYNFLPGLNKEILEKHGVSTAWDLKSQLVFGVPGTERFQRDRERTYKPVEPRVKIFGA
jgi:uncharacterized protein